MKRRKLAPIVDLAKFRHAREDAALATQRATEREELRHRGERILQIGIELAVLGHLSAAVHCFRAVIACDPTNACAWFNLGVTTSDQGEITTARVAFEEALQLDPKYADAHWNLGKLLDEHFGDKKAATRHLRAYNRLMKEDRS